MAVTLSLALSGPAAAETTDQAAITLLVRLESAAKYIGSPKVCEEPDETGEIALCFMELYEAKAVVLRNFGGAVMPRRITIRFTAHSFHAVWKEDVRFL